MFSGTFATCSEGTTLPSLEQSRGSGPGHFMVCPAKAAFDLSWRWVGWRKARLEEDRAALWAQGL